MQPIFRLIEGNTLRALQNLVRDFLAAMRRQTVHHQGITLRHLDDLAIDLIVPENAPAALRLFFLAHARPNIRVNSVCSTDSFRYRLRNTYICAGGECLGKDIAIGLIAFWARQCERKRHYCCRLEPGMDHIIAVADKGDLQAVKLAFVLHQRLAVGQHLTGMIKIGQRIDHRNRGISGHLFECSLGKRAHGNQVYPAGQAARAIRRRFPRPEPNLRAAHEKNTTAQLIHADFKSRAGAQTGLFKH